MAKASLATAILRCDWSSLESVKHLADYMAEHSKLGYTVYKNPSRSSYYLTLTKNVDSRVPMSWVLYQTGGNNG